MSNLIQIQTFLEEYTLFFEEMVEAEKTKLNILLSNDLKAIEENILTQQVNAKRIENMENRRIKLFKDLGYENVSLKDVIHMFSSETSILQTYYTRIDQALKLIKHFNKKSLELIRFNLSMSEQRNQNMDSYDMKGTR